MVECRVEFDYDAQQEDELSIKPGEIIKNVTQQDGGWWEGELNGKRGMFPDNFVKIIKPEAKSKASSKSSSKDSAKTTPNTTDDFKIMATTSEPGQSGVKSGPSVKELKNQLSKQVSLQGTGRRDTKKKKLARVRATQAYTADEDDELSFDVGDIIEVTEKDSDNWWRGQLVNKDLAGSFPVKYTELLDDDEHDYSAEVTEIQPKKVKGVGLGDIFKNEPIKLRSTKKEPGTKASSSSPDESVPVPPKPIKPRTSIIRESKGQPEPQFAKVLFAYDSVNEDELSLKEGEQVLVLDKDIEDEGWWKGEVNGKKGVFPNNFVQLIEPKPKRPTAAPKKLSERPLPQEPKAEKTTTPKEDRPPPLPGKKPDMPPPPISKKPSKPPIKEEKTTPTEEFDMVESSTPLKNLNVNRPKGPVKRPPSQIQHSKPEVNGDGDDGYEKPWNDAASIIDSLSGGRVKDDPPRQRPPPVPPAPSRTVNHAYVEVPDGPIVSNKVIEDMQNEIRDLKANTVSKKAHDELKTELQDLREQLQIMRKQFDKRLVALMNEIDEEKKLRYQNQVEMERIKKLTLSNLDESET